MQEGFFAVHSIFMIVAPAFLPNINCLYQFFRFPISKILWRFTCWYHFSSFN